MVVFPAPDGPINATDVFFSILKDASFITLSTPSSYVNDRFSTEISLSKVMLSTVFSSDLRFDNAIILCLSVYTDSTNALLYISVLIYELILLTEGRSLIAPIANTPRVVANATLISPIHALIITIIIREPMHAASMTGFGIEFKSALSFWFFARA